MATDPSDQAAENVLAGIVSNADQVPRDIVAAWAKMALAPETMAVVREVVRSGVDAFGQREAIILRDRLAEIRMPTLIVWGSDDPVFPVSHALDANRLVRGSALRIFARCLHCPPFERHREFNELLLRFVESPNALI